MSNTADRMPAAGPADSPLVAFGCKWPIQKKRRHALTSPWRRSHLVLFALVMVFIVLLSSRVVSSLHVALALLAAIFVGHWLFQKAPWRDIERWKGVPESPPSTARVACIGQPSQLDIFARQGPIRDEFLEAFVCNAPFALRTWTLAWLLPFSVGVIIAMFIAFAFGLNRAIFGWAAGLLVGSCGAVLLWPTILRITPGKFEVLERSMLNTRTLTHTTFDLRQSAVLVDLNQEVVFIARDGGTHEVWIKSAADPHAIAAAILRAAISTHTAPALPDDAIVG